MDETGFPKEGAEETILPRSRATPKDSQKKERHFPQELATVDRTLAASVVQPTFLSGHVLGPPHWQLSCLHMQEPTAGMP